MINFNDWLIAQESSPFTRTRRAAALGLGPSIPDAEINSHSTALPWEKDRIVRRNKKKKKKRRHIKEAKNPSYINKDVDKWLSEVENLKEEVDRLIKTLEKKGKKNGKLLVKGKSNKSKEFEEPEDELEPEESEEGSEESEESEE